MVQPQRANERPCYRGAVSVHVSERGRVGLDHVTSWEAAGTAQRERMRFQPEWSGLGPDNGDARGLTPPGEIPTTVATEAFLDGYSSSDQKREPANSPRLDGENHGHGYDSSRKTHI